MKHLKYFVTGLLTSVLVLSASGFNAAQAADIPTSTDSNYTAIASQRLFDTRFGGGALAAGTTLTRNATGLRGVPSYGVSAVMLNITVVSPTASGYITAFPADASRPVVSNVNYSAGNIISNQALVKTSLSGQVSFFTSAQTQLVVDIVGWVAAPALTPSASNLIAVTPSRVADSRNSIGNIYGTFTSGTTKRVKVTGVGGVPAHAKAVFLNLTSTSNAKSSQYVTVYPSGTNRPLASSLNQSQSVVANQILTPVGSDGAVEVYSAVASTNIILDVQGYIVAGVAKTATTVAVSPQRVLDTRLAGNRQPLTNGQSRRLALAGTNGIPTNASSVFVHITAVNQTGRGYAKVDAYGGVPGAGSAMNYDSGAVVSASASTSVGPDGAIVLTNMAGPTHFVVDVMGWTVAPTLVVTPPKANTLKLPLPQDAAGMQSRAILNNANKYAMTTWWNGDGKMLLSTPLTYDLNELHGGGVDPVRRLSNEAYGLATSLALNNYDPSVTGVSKQVALDRTIMLINYVARNHITNTANGWGAGWQTSFWAGYTARAAWLLWPQLSAQDQNYVAKMIRFEADDAAGKSLPYLRDADGMLLRNAGDTGADDTSWYAMPMQIASQMLPNDSHVAIWNYRSIEMALAAWSRPQDVNDTTMINGQPISSWINGSNVEANGIVMNHNRIAPDYMTLTYQTTDDIWLNALAGKSAPIAAKSLIANVYSAYTTVNFQGPAYKTPGGYIYSANSADIYYPQGIDWGPGQQLPYALVDTNAVAYGYGNVSAARYQLLHGQAQLDMQARFSDGHTYLDNTEYRYPGREEHVSQLAAEMLLANYVANNKLVSFDNDSRITPLN